MQDKLIEAAAKAIFEADTGRLWSSLPSESDTTRKYRLLAVTAVRAHDAGTDEGLPTDRRPCPNCGRSDGWHYAPGHAPLPVGDCRKIVWMRDKDEMEWWGVRAYNHAEGYWQSNSREESSTVLFWMETPHSPHYPPASHAASTAPDAGENAEHYVAQSCGCVGKCTGHARAQGVRAAVRAHDAGTTPAEAVNNADNDRGWRMFCQSCGTDAPCPNCEVCGALLTMVQNNDADPAPTPPRAPHL